MKIAMSEYHCSRVSLMLSVFGREYGGIFFQSSRQLHITKILLLGRFTFSAALGQFISEYSFKRKDIAVIIKNPTAITHDGEVINIDHQ